MENEGTLGVGIVGIIIIISLWVHVNTLNKKIEAREDMINSCSSQIDDANQNIEDANSQIDDAQGNAWSDYDTMGDTLDGLQSTETVSNDCYIPTDN